MEVIIRFLSYLSEIVGLKKCLVKVPKNATLKDLINIVKSRWPQLGNVNLEEGSQLLLLLNGTMADPDTKLKDGDEIVIFPPASGGKSSCNVS